MTFYDLIFLGLLVILGFWGFSTGALRQIVNLLSFFVAITGSALSKSWLSRVFHLDSTTGWIATIVVFLVLFLGLRYLGHALSDKLHKEKAAGNIDRGLGAVIGVVWTLMIIGVFHLIFCYVTPSGKRPDWFTHAKVYSLSARCAGVIQHLLPQGTGMADKVAPEVEK